VCQFILFNNYQVFLIPSQVMERFLSEDISKSSTPSLPHAVTNMHNQTIRGPFVLQASAIIDVSEPLESRLHTFGALVTGVASMVHKPEKGLLSCRRVQTSYLERTVLLQSLAVVWIIRDHQERWSCCWRMVLKTHQLLSTDTYRSSRSPTLYPESK